MRKIQRTLIVRADGEARIVKSKRPILGFDEVAFELHINIINMPDAWGEVVGKLEIAMPEPPSAEITQSEG